MYLTPRTKVTSRSTGATGVVFENGVDDDVHVIWANGVMEKTTVRALTFDRDAELATWDEFYAAIDNIPGRPRRNETAESTTQAQIVRRAFDRLIADGQHTDGVVTLVDLSTEARVVAVNDGTYFAGPQFTAGVDQIVAEGVLRRVGTDALQTTQRY